MRLTTKNDCWQAVAALGGKTDPSYEADNEKIPSGCSYRDEPADHPHAHWNTNAAGSGRKDLAPVCYKTEHARAYQMMSYGASGCSDGLNIESKDDCWQAVAALGGKTDPS